MMFHLTHLFFGAVTLVLPHEAHVRGTELHLADLVQVRGDAAEIEKLASLSIGYAPAPGYTRLVRRDELARQVQAAFPGSAIEIEGAEACRVIPDVERVDGASIRAAAENEMRALFASRDAAIGLQGEVQSLDVPRAITKRELRTR